MCLQWCIYIGHSIVDPTQPGGRAPDTHHDPHTDSLGSEADMIEGVAMSSSKGRAGHAQHLIQYIRDSTELVILHC